MVLGLKQMRLAAGVLASVAKASDHNGIANAIDLALKATDFGEALRQQDPVAVALRDVSTKLEKATREALSGEFGADWESKPDLSATLVALPEALEYYAPNPDAILTENLNPERIGRRAVDAAEAAHDDLFRRNTIGGQLLFSVVRQTYVVALTNKDFALQMILRGQSETLNRLDEHKAQLNRLEQLLSGNHSAARALLEIRAILCPNVPDIQGVTDERLPDIVRRILAEASKPSANPADFSGAVRRALEQAYVHIANLEFATAARVLDAQLAHIEAENRDRVREHAALLAQRGRVAALQLRYLDAAGFHRQASALMAFDKRAAWGHSMDAARALSNHGSEFGDNQILHDAIVAYRMALYPGLRERVPLDWAMTQNDLSTALSTLGDRESGTAYLEDAVAACREALKERTRDRVPLDWAMTQMNLGNALRMFGQRESGTARLEEAVTAYRMTLEEWTRERVPLHWARAQMNLGSVLYTIGERESGTARLEEAVAAYNAALEEMTRERVPLDWAMTQMNLGNALRMFGQRESGTARLEEAVAAYRMTLKEMTRDRDPLGWALTQTNLGNALSELGARESETARLKEAAAAHRAALEEMTRDRGPLGWALTQMNLGNALSELGARESGTVHLEKAAAAHRAALEEMTRGRNPLGWARIQMNLGSALVRLGGRDGVAARLEDAVTACREALKEVTRDRVPLDWAMTQMNLGSALFIIGMRESGTACLEEAMTAWAACLTIASDWQPELIEKVRSAHEETQAEIARRSVK